MANVPGKPSAYVFATRRGRWTIPKIFSETRPLRFAAKEISCWRCATWKKADIKLSKGTSIGTWDIRTLYKWGRAVLLDIFLENTMRETCLDHHTIFIGAKMICNLCFADYIDLIADTNREQQDLTNRLKECWISYWMENSYDKSKVVAIGNGNVDIYKNGKRLKEVNRNLYLRQLSGIS